MTVIDGKNVAIYKCETCGAAEMWIFKDVNGNGYKIACAVCGIDQRNLINELDLKYLWVDMEEG